MVVDTMRFTVTNTRLNECERSRKLAFHNFSFDDFPTVIFRGLLNSHLMLEELHLLYYQLFDTNSKFDLTFGPVLGIFQD